MSTSKVSHRVNRSLGLLIVTGLIALAVVFWATAALAGIHLPGQQPFEGVTVERVVAVPSFHQMTTGTVTVYTPPPPPPAPRPRVSGKCYAEPGTPPQSVLDREVKGAGYDPTVYNFGGSGANGCWQFMDGTWGGYKGYKHAADAPVHIQNERAKQVWAGGKGCNHWAAC